MKAKKLITIFSCILLGVVLFFVGFSYLLGRSFHSQQVETYNAVSKISLHCPAGTVQAIEYWGKVGYSVSCRRNGVKDGPWQAWEYGYLNIAGEYKDGKEHGTWLVHNKDGTTFRTIKYDAGKELSNVMHRKE